MCRPGPLTSAGTVGWNGRSIVCQAGWAWVWEGGRGLWGAGGGGRKGRRGPHPPSLVPSPVVETYSQYNQLSPWGLIASVEFRPYPRAVGRFYHAQRFAARYFKLCYLRARVSSCISGYFAIHNFLPDWNKRSTPAATSQGVRPEKPDKIYMEVVYEHIGLLQLMTALRNGRRE